MPACSARVSLAFAEKTKQLKMKKRKMNLKEKKQDAFLETLKALAKPRDAWYSPACPVCRAPHAFIPRPIVLSCPTDNHEPDP